MYVEKLNVPTPNVALYEENGLEFVAPDVNKLDELCDTLTKARVSCGQFAEFAEIPDPDQAVAYLPELLLTNKPTEHQLRLINEQETASVADYALGVQAKVAQIAIIESHERMTYLPDYLSNNGVIASFSTKPFHETCGDWAGKGRVYWSREGIASRLTLMGKILASNDRTLHIEDAFRPVGVQEGLFKRRMDWTVADHPTWDTEAQIRETQSKTAVTPRLASHKAGAAIDAFLRDTITREIVDFGHEYPVGGAIVFPQTIFITEQQWLERQSFQIAAGLSGLTLYVGEDWHVSYGDNLASLDRTSNVRDNYTAVYGPIKSFDEASGEIIETYDASAMDTVFDYK